MAYPSKYEWMQQASPSQMATEEEQLKKLTGYGKGAVSSLPKSGLPDMPQGGYFASAGGQSMTNVPAYKQEVSVPTSTPGARPIQYPAATTAPVPSGVPAMDQAMQYAMSSGASVLSPGQMDQRGAESGTLRGVSAPVLDKYGQPINIDPTGVGLSTMDAMKRRMALRGEGSPTERRLALATNEREKEAAHIQSQKREEAQFTEMAKRKGIVAEQTAAGKERGEAPAKALAAQNAREMEEFRQTGRRSLKMMDQDFKADQAELARTAKEGLTAENNQVKERMQMRAIEATRSLTESQTQAKGLKVGSDEWRQAHQQNVDDKIKELQAAGAITDARQVESFKANATLDLAKSLITNYQAKNLQEAVALAEGVGIEQKPSIGKATETPGDKIQKQMKIADAVKVADMFTEEQAKALGEVKYKIWQKAVILKKLTAKKQVKSLEDEVKAEYGLE